jgi:polysaccharide biosynthesis protein PslG
LCAKVERCPLESRLWLLRQYLKCFYSQDQWRCGSMLCMTTMKRILLLLLVALAACVPQTPIPVYITPTPMDAAALPTQTSPTPSATNTPTPTATVTETATISPTPLITPSYVGPLIGEGYTPPPTFTIAPTVVTPTRTTPSLPDLDAARVGVQIDPYLAPETWAYAMDRASQLGVRWIKIQLNWALIQAESASQYGLEAEAIEGFIRQADARGINVMISIAKAPGWARGISGDGLDGPPATPQQLADFITFYLRSGVGMHEMIMSVDAIEVWNEPNLEREWGGQEMSGASYMTYFNAAYNAIRAISPTMPIITAGLAPAVDSSGSRDDRVYLAEMYAAGLGNYTDVYVGIHPYGWGNPPDARCCDATVGITGWDDNPHFFFLETLDAYREVMNDNGHENVQMWITELGWSSWEGFPGSPSESEVWMQYTDEIEQGLYLVRALEIAQSRQDVGMVFVWNMNFADQTRLDRGDERATYSLLLPSRVRPGFWMLLDALTPGFEINDYLNYSG